MVAVPVKDSKTVRDRIEARKAADERRKVAIEKQRQLWTGLSAYIRQNGGWLVSTPAESPLRIEVPAAASLPDRLYDLGYDLQPAGTNERIEGGKFLPVVCFTFKIPLGR